MESPYLTDSEEEDTSSEGFSFTSDCDSSSDSEGLEATLEGYTSSVDSDGDAETEENVEDETRLILLFYETLLLELMDTFSVGRSDVIASIRHLINNYGKVRSGCLPTDIDYKNKSHCLGYLHRYAACHTAMVFKAVSAIFESSSSDILSSKLNRKDINVMFLGGGPGNDFVGFLAALHGHHDHLFDLDVTVVDKMAGWEEVFSRTVDKLRQGGCGKAGAVLDDVNVTPTFISADLTDSDEWDENMEAKMESAHIVFLVKTLSHIPDSIKLQVLQNIACRMKVGSLLVYMDYPYPCEVFAELSPSLTLVYRSLKVKHSFTYVYRDFEHENITFCRAEVRVYQR